MAFNLLATPEPLLKQGHYLGLIGDWGEHYTKQWYRVKRTRVTVRDWSAGIVDAATATIPTVDPSTAALALQPRYYETIYQARIGIAPDLRVYIQWPTTEYQMALEEPNRAPVPTDIAGANLQAYIGYVDSKDSPIAPRTNSDRSTILDDLRFEFFFVRDWLPVFRVMADYFTGMAAAQGHNRFSKIILRFLVNMMTITPVADTAIRTKLEQGQLIYKPVLHYSELVGRGVTSAPTEY